MTGRWAASLESRGVLRATGSDLRAFLQGMISNDITKLTGEAALWSAFLTPQGKFLHEFFLVEEPETAPDPAVLMDCEAARLADLKQRFERYKLRSKFDLAEATARWSVIALFGEGALDALELPAEPGRTRTFAGGVVFVDPRLAALGARAVLPRDRVRDALDRAGFDSAEAGAYDALRIALGVPDGSRDLEVERSPLLENGFDELNGIDWDKGCFVGQELTARTRYRALIKKRLLPVEIDGPVPAPGTAILLAGKEVGIMRSATEGIGLALLRLAHLDRAASGTLNAGDARLTPRPPDWIKI